MLKSANKISFWRNPTGWLIRWVTKSNMPLLWKADIIRWHMNWKTYRRHFKDQLLGTFVVVTVSTLEDWTIVKGKFTESRVRRIKYRWKRAKIPFAYPKIRCGVQCVDEQATPLGDIPFETLALVNDRMFEYRQRVEASNEKRANHQKLKASIIDHKFQEYNHDA
ncbi:hypothetical protein AH04_187 [Erwinia phage AH04]|uniref:Uncharacterized protein n=1 Tax=Erwinia phage AH04 TaxID=2869569 RepID=A0AAE7X2I0_9CAUD|nr:hypothetical protein PQC02_gp127 [Erwinia phage AH04]QZA70662.1 hypothetical protein AH04_187 [Erwinia phage AH04]